MTDRKLSKADLEHTSRMARRMGAKFVARTFDYPTANAERFEGEALSPSPA